MAVGSLQDLCAGFCDIAGVPAPELVPGANGLIAFHVDLRGVTVNVMHAPQGSTEHAFILVEFGAIPDGADGPRILQTLLDANFLPLRAYPPTFARNPVTGDVVLQLVYPLFNASPVGLLEVINSGIDLALRWREGFFLEPAPAGHAPGVFGQLA